MKYEYDGYMNRKRNGTGYDMTVVFKYEDKEFNVEVDIPFDIFIEAIRQYSAAVKDVVLDGTDTDIWNLFVEVDGLDYFAEQEYVLDSCREIYYKSYQYELDLEKWTDEYEYDHEIGKYAPEKEGQEWN